MSHHLFVDLFVVHLLKSVSTMTTRSCLVLRYRLSAWLIGGPQPIFERLNELQLMCMVNISNEQRIQEKEKINMVSSS